jgi:hypothetical protein
VTRGVRGSNEHSLVRAAIAVGPVIEYDLLRDT